MPSVCLIETLYAFACLTPCGPRISRASTRSFKNRVSFVLVHELAALEAFFGAEFLGDEKCEFECDKRGVEVSVDIGRIDCSRHICVRSKRDATCHWAVESPFMEVLMKLSCRTYGYKALLP
jgi:hypothetical protein